MSDLEKRRWKIKGVFLGYIGKNIYIYICASYEDYTTNLITIYNVHE